MTDNIKELPMKLRTRTAALVLALTAAFALAACSDQPDSQPVDVSPSVTASSAADEAGAVYRKYWDVYVQASATGELPASAFDGIADGTFLELLRKDLRDQAESDVRRVGKPGFGDFVTTVDGTSARSVVCFDETTWGAEVDGEPIAGSTSDTPDPRPFVAMLEQRDDGWIVTDVALDEDDQETCS